MSGSSAAKSPKKPRSNSWPRRKISKSSKWEFSPRKKRLSKFLRPGEVGYIVANIKKTSDVKIGDTITTLKNPASEALPGFRQITPVVFAGIYPVDSSDFEAVRDALVKLQLNDSALHVEQESSLALGFGFRCGFLGLLHLEIVFERLQREFDLDIITTAPSVIYKFTLNDGKTLEIDNVAHYPDPSHDRMGRRAMGQIPHHGPCGIS